MNIYKYSYIEVVYDKKHLTEAHYKITETYKNLSLKERIDKFTKIFRHPCSGKTFKQFQMAFLGCKTLHIQKELISSKILPKLFFSSSPSVACRSNVPPKGNPALKHI